MLDDSIIQRWKQYDLIGLQPESKCLMRLRTASTRAPAPRSLHAKNIVFGRVTAGDRVASMMTAR